ncbi:serine hydrolase [Streptomyces sp. NPDC013181]|uniref:D-alanyl-D-alanine carboxypeptidase n=1 Tax=Streptomyces sp. NPDC013181 TaxID=3364864 RepID=UPI0036876387
MEEASVAGESPDKSEQQQSSGTTRNERDPRLGVFRERDEDRVAPGASDTDAGKAPEADESSDVDDATDDGTTAEAGKAPETDETPETGKTAGASEAADDAGSAPDPAGTPEKAPEGPADAQDGPEGTSGGSGAAQNAAEGGEPEAGEPGDARLRAAVAAWVSTADDEGGTAGGDDAAGDEVAGEAGRKSPKAPESAKAPTGEAVPPAEEEEPEADAPEAGDPEAGDQEPGAAPTSKKSAPDAEPKAPGAESKKPAAEPEKPAAGEPAPDAKPKSPAAEPKGSDDAEPPVDQPTAVFKAPRLPKVDQPTTALKITRSPSGRPVAAESESLTERGSTFVPLRSDDVRPATTPPPRRPESPAPDAALSGAERTRQQPMPPKPPLDLLAELTNTPPPPETPVRTAVRRVKIWTPLVLLLLLVFAIVQIVRPLPDPSLAMTAKTTYSFEGETPKLPWPDQGQGYMAATGLGRIGSFGEQKPVPIASVAKAMTAYIVLKSHPLKRGEEGPKIEVDAKAEADGKLYTEGESTLNTVKEGDYLTERQALSALMIPSANNVARLLARWEAGSEKAFVAKMNATADELGMKNTTYTDPSGLTASTVSTAEDLVKLGEKLVEFPALMDITKLPEWKDPSGHTWRNYNTLVPFDGALGIKTGSTSKAGGNLLFAAHKMIDGTDQLVVGAILGQYDDVSIIDEVNRVSKRVMLATLDVLEGAKVVKKGDVVGQVDDGMGHTTPVVATKDVEAVGWAGLTVKLELTDDGRTIPHEAVAGTHVGTLTVGEGRSQVKVAVALQKDLAKPSVSDKLTRLG